MDVIVSEWMVSSKIVGQFQDFFHNQPESLEDLHVLLRFLIFLCFEHFTKVSFFNIQGYFLLFESMLDTVLLARDKWLKPDGCGKT